MLKKFCKSATLHIRVVKSKSSKMQKLSSRESFQFWNERRLFCRTAAANGTLVTQDFAFNFPSKKHLSLIAYFGLRTFQSSLLSNAVYFKTDEF